MAEEKNNKKGKKFNITLIVLFFAAFSTTILLFHFLFKNFSIPVDVSIGNNTEKEEIEEEDYSALQKDVDDRLKWIQYEDNNEEEHVSNSVSELLDRKQQEKEESESESESQINEEPIPALEPLQLKEPEKVVAYKQLLAEQETKNNEIKENSVKEENNTPKENEAVKSAANLQDDFVIIPTKMTKVYLGFYNSNDEANEELAKVAPCISGLSPYVKSANGKYIVQIASFADRNKALNLKIELENKGFPARLLSD